MFLSYLIPGLPAEREPAAVREQTPDAEINVIGVGRRASGGAHNSTAWTGAS